MVRNVLVEIGMSGGSRVVATWGGSSRVMIMTQLLQSTAAPDLSGSE